MTNSLLCNPSKYDAWSINGAKNDALIMLITPHTANGRVRDQPSIASWDFRVSFTLTSVSRRTCGKETLCYHILGSVSGNNCI